MAKIYVSLGYTVASKTTHLSYVSTPLFYMELGLRAPKRARLSTTTSDSDKMTVPDMSAG
jgi:hypothetical protein